MRSALTALAAALTVIVPAAGAAPPRAAALAARLETLRAAAFLPAVGGAIFSSDRLDDVAATGVRQMLRDVPVSIGDRWHIGSITKSFTATLVAMRVERGELSWSSTLGDLLGADRAGKFAPVTLTDLLSHRAGLPANVPGPVVSAQVASGAPLPEQRQRALDAVLSGVPASAPGEAYLYSNAGYIIAGALLEARAKRPWEEMIRHEVLAPLKLSGAGFGAPGTDNKIDQPRGHRQRPDGSLLVIGPGPQADNPPFFGPAGTLHMTIRDLARWGQEHLRGERGRNGVVRADTMRRLHEPPRPGADYAFGWVVRRDPGGRVIWHNGSNTLWYAIVAFDPAADRGVVIVTNGSIGAGRAVDAAAMELVSLATGGAGFSRPKGGLKPAPPPEF